MRKTIFLLSMLFSLSLQAQRSFELPNSADGESKLYVYLPSAEKSTGRAIVCCPGGGYAHLAMTYEGTDWAPYFNDMGIALIVLKYRMPHGDRNIPIGDAERAMVTVRATLPRPSPPMLDSKPVRTFRCFFIRLCRWTRRRVTVALQKTSSAMRWTA